MSLQLIQKVLHKFVATDVPEVICLRGKWGIGKTYAWNKLLQEAIANSQVALPLYAYVSLFGLNSIDELRQSIFENLDSTKGPHLSMKDKLDSFGREAAKKIAKYSSYAKIPYIDAYVQNFAGGFRYIVSETIHETIICIDDLERKGKAFRTADIMGVVSQLKEAKRCKIIFIMNADELSEDDKNEFETYFEKVIDAVIDFQPTPQESLEIALEGSDELHGWLRSNCADLGISNIRIIKKIERLALIVGELLQTYNSQLRKEIIRSLTVLAWSIYSREDAPPIEFVLKRSYSQYLQNDENAGFTDEELAWNQVLNAYGFTHCDALDLVLIEGIQRGFFDEQRVAAEADKQRERNDAHRAEAALTESWRLYHNSFESNEAEVAQRLFEGTMANIKYLDLTNLNAVLIVLKDIGEAEKASRLLQHYLSERADEPGIFDLSAHPFAGDITEPELVAAFAQRASAAKPPPPSPLEACQRIYRNDFSSENLKVLSQQTADDLYALFKPLKGDELSTAVFGALKFRQIGNATQEQRGIAAKAEEALQRIGNESPLNRHRMKKYRVKVEITVA